ncbi:MAG TPA: tryptophan synthase subunit alpha [Phycisphaerales bacterium]|nr:tryptophan synthase subunit alpha [Phycisphaerales bacterium]
MPIASTISDRIRRHAARGTPALIPYITAGFPTKDAFAPQLRALQKHAALVEVGVPFSDPMADGATIQHSSRRALESGVTLDWILATLAELKGSLESPVALMSYLNPLIHLGMETLAARCAESGVALLIIPDLPLEESAGLRAALHARGVGLVQLVSPVTPPERAAHLARHSDGFLYAVTVTGVTGATAQPGAPVDLDAYLGHLRSVSPVPVCAGFGIRSRQQVRALSGNADGAIVGSALIAAIERGEDAGAFLASLAGE